jgi:hypothetical protein
MQVTNAAGTGIRITITLMIVFLMFGLAARGWAGTARFVPRTGLHRRGIGSRSSFDRAELGAADLDRQSADDEAPTFALPDDQDEDSFPLHIRTELPGSMLPAAAPWAALLLSPRSCLFIPVPSTPLRC